MIFFNGKCPYTDKPCLEKISCVKCQVDADEKEMMEQLDRQEELEMLMNEEVTE